LSVVVDAVGRILSRGGDADEVLRAVVAMLVSAHVLLGWETGGEGWTP
jgi:hypothetical protein